MDVSSSLLPAGQSLQHLEAKHAELQRSLDTQSTSSSSLQTKLAELEASNFALLSTVQEHKEQRDQSHAEASQLRSRNAAWERRTEEIEGELATRRLESNNFGVSHTGPSRPSRARCDSTDLILPSSFLLVFSTRLRRSSELSSCPTQTRRPLRTSSPARPSRSSSTDQQR